MVTCSCGGRFDARLSLRNQLDGGEMGTRRDRLKRAAPPLRAKAGCGSKVLVPKIPRRLE